ncbi:MAG: hypothetical protein JSW65_00875 [Candidatus Bipolaricaulota bacterium]|nr:MAG: hypothetical protein JSW65_00875 [Candidatus Bipolaricaulota bacterium]
MTETALRRLSRPAAASVIVVVLLALLPLTLGSQTGTETEACCFADGSCDNLDPGACVDLGGVPQGVGTICSDVTCPQPTQACCLPDGSCADLSYGECIDQGGEAQGDGTTCSDVICTQPTQACCLPDGSCADLSYGECMDQGGEPQGDGTTCGITPCAPATQACCLPDGGCRDLDVEGCRGAGGAPQGEGTDCGHTSCPQPTRVCCFPDGSCQDLEARECRTEGGSPRGSGSSCFRTRCPQPATPPSSIRLLAPLPGEGLEPEAPSVPFCWEALGIPGVTYEVIHEGKHCDPEVLNGPHPFAPLIPDPELARRHAEQRVRVREIELHLAALLEYCESLDELFAQVGQRLREIPDELAGLERGRDEADAAQVDSEEAPFELPLTSSCPRTPAEMLAPFADQIDDLEVPPCLEDPCRELSDALSALVGLLQSLQAHAVVQRLEFERLLQRWVDGADHRGTMELYHELFSFVDGAISVVTDLIDLLTPDLEAELRSLIEETLTDAVCRQHPELCEAIETAQTVRDQLATIRSILNSARSTGTPGPAFIVQMVQAMAQQAAAATAVAVEGWASFAEYMSAVLWDAYESLLCEQQALEWLRDRRDRIEALCDACLECLQQELAAAEDDLEETEGLMEAEAQAREAYWQEQSAAISAAIGQVGQYLDDDWYEACCQESAVTIAVPGETLCAQRLEEALKEALGDRACFLTFSCTLECEFQEGQLVGASVQCEHSFPLAERRPCCCVPCARTPTSMGEEPDPGTPGSRVCGGPDGTEAAPGAGTWRVEARDEEGRLVGESPRRLLGPGGITEPRALPPIRPTCICSVTASVNGAPVASGGLILATQGVPATIGVGGDCGPPCAPGATSIAIRPPAPAPPWLGWAVVFPPPPISAAGPVTTYDFPAVGRYSVTVSRLCEDGTECTSSFEVLTVPPPGPVLRGLRDGDDPSMCCPACGADPCLALSYGTPGDPPLAPAAGHRLLLRDRGRIHLLLESDCRPDCPEARTVRWEFTPPSGEREIYEGIDLYALDYDLKGPGETLLCAIETIPCGGTAHRFESWWIFDVRGHIP